MLRIRVATEGRGPLRVADAEPEPAAGLLEPVNRGDRPAQLERAVRERAEHGACLRRAIRQRTARDDEVHPPGAGLEIERDPPARGPLAKDPLRLAAGR